MEDREQFDLDSAIARLEGWWADHAHNATKRTVPKAIEYGSSDIDLMGAAMASMMRGELAGATDAERLQFGRYAAISFYALGKIARIFGALEQGKLPHPDSEFDLEVYAIMLARVRETGGWPS